MRHTRGRLLGAARRIGSSQDAEDSVQGTYHALLRRGKPTDGPLWAWLLTVVVRIAYRRKALAQRHAALAERLAIPHDEVTPPHRAARAERARWVRAEVAGLPEKYRDVLILRYFEALSRNECATLLGVSPETVKTRSRRGRTLLRGRLHPRVRHAILFVPWLFADKAAAAAASWAAPTGGILMNSKVLIVVALVAVVGLLALSTDVFRAERTTAETRTVAPEPDRTKKAPPSAVPVAPQEKAPRPYDLLAVDRDRDVHGVVVTKTGAPVAGARLTLVRHPWRRTNVLHAERHHDGSKGPAAISAVDGSFVLPWRQGAVGELRVEAEGFVRRGVTEVQAGERVRVTLVRGATVRVHVRAPDQSSLADVELVLRHSTAGAPGPWARRAKTNGDGRAEFVDVCGDQVSWIRARHAQWGTPNWKRVERVEAADGVDVAIEMRKRRVITGRVTDAVRGAAVVGARVGWGWMQQDAVATDADGRYELASKTTEHDMSVAVTAPGFARQHATAKPDATVVDVALPPGDRVTGRVVDKSGDPLAGVQVAALGLMIAERSFWSRAYAVSDKNGTFAVEGLRHDAPHVLVLFAEGVGRRHIDIERPPQAGGTVALGNIALAPGRTIGVRVVDPAGAPIPRLRVTLRGANHDRGQRPVRGRRAPANTATEESRVTDDLGRVRFPDLAPGRYAASVSRPGRARVNRTVDLTAERDELDLVMRFDNTRSFTLDVVDSDGKGVPNALFRVRHDGGGQGGRIGPDGRAVLQVRGAISELVVTVIFPGSSQPDVAFELPARHAPLRADESSARIVLKRAGIVRGVVLLPDGTPVFRPVLAVVAEDGTERGRTTGNEDGSFRAAIPAAGLSTLVFLGHGVRGQRYSEMNAPYRGELRGVAAGRTDLVVRLEPLPTGRRLSVRLADPDGEPLEGVIVSTSQHGRAIRSGADGRVHFDEHVAKKTTIWVRGNVGGLVPPEPRVVIPEGQEVEVRFARGVPLRGIVSVSKPSEAPWNVIILSGKKPVAVAPCEKDGTFVAYIHPNAGQGPFRVEAVESGPNGRRVAAPHVLLGGTDVRIDVR